MVRSVILGVAIALSGNIASAAAAQDAQATRGLQVFADQKCSVCHSVAGKGNKNGPLDAIGGRLSAEEIRQWIVDAKGMTAKTKADRKPPMKVFSLPNDEVDALVAYLQTMKKK